MTQVQPNTSPLGLTYPWNAFPLYANLGRYPAAGMAFKSLKNMMIRVTSPVN